VVGGPTTASDGSIWWNINYDTGADGWSIETYLQNAGSSAYTYSQAAYTGYIYSQSTYSTGCASGCTNYYITTTGSDSNSCTQISPCKTINGVDSKLGGSLPLGSGGTTIHVAAGRYSGPITTNRSGTATARIVWLSDTKWGAKIT